MEIQDVDIVVDVVNKEYKTPEYIRRAKLNYMRRKIESDPEYKQKLKDNTRKYVETHRAELNKKRRENRAKLKQVKEHNSEKAKNTPDLANPINPINPINLLDDKMQKISISVAT